MILKMDLDWLRQQVELIPGDAGWLTPENGEDFVVLGAEMIDKGLDRYSAIEILTRAYWAVANEFGL